MSAKAKSHFFAVWNPTTDANKGFQRDVDFALQIPQAKIMSLYKFVADFGLAYTDTERQKIVEKIAEHVELLEFEISKILALFYWITKQMLPNGEMSNDNPTLLAEDMAEYGIIKKDSMSVVEGWFSKLFQITNKEIFLRKRKREAVSSVLPILTNVEMVIDVRAVFDKQYIPTQMNPNDYFPECMGVEPVAIFQFRLEKTDSEEICFQASKRTLKLLVDIIESAQIEIGKITEYLNLNHTEA